MRSLTVGICATVLGIIFLASVFDIYFTSPIVKGANLVANDVEPPAKRLVLIVADGLRAQSVIRDNTTITARVPFLSNVAEKIGSWGVAHTRVPTESRPGHVALIAGFYEDPSAITKGWKDVPVDFDSIFNQSEHTFAWGSPDIVNIFTKNAPRGNIDAFTYPLDLENISGKSSYMLDTWVGNKVEEFFESLSQNVAMKQRVFSNRIVFFLHLLGLDMAGHFANPDSDIHTLNLAIVDSLVNKTVALFEKVFEDHRTSYVFTSDHGMTDWGSHGAGSPAETQTPVYVWGAGVAKNPLRQDIAQADCVPLMAVLLGIPIPGNSQGTLPESFLSMSHHDKAKALLVNARQVMAQYEAKRNDTEKDVITWFYRPFKPFAVKPVEQRFGEIQRDISSGNYQTAMTKCRRLISLTLDGLEYYQNYYQPLMLAHITLAYIGWIINLLIELGDSKSKSKIPEYIDPAQKRSPSLSGTNYISLVFATLLITTNVFLNVQNLPVRFYIYCNLPIILWSRIFLKYKVWMGMLRSRSADLRKPTNLAAKAIIFLAGIEMIVSTFFFRPALSVLTLLVMLWPFAERIRCSLASKIVWVITCLGLAIFPTMPVVGKEFNSTMVLIGFLLWIILLIVAVNMPQLRLFGGDNELGFKYKYVTSFQFVFLALSMWNCFDLSSSNLKLTNLIVSWFLLVSAAVMPLFSSTMILNRLVAITTSMVTAYGLLTVTHELIFLLCLALNLFCWLHFEKVNSRLAVKAQLATLSFTDHKEDRSGRSVSLSDFRKVLFFFFYVWLSFFGTGNVASVNSFDPKWSRAFIRIFNPFTIMGLVLCKLLLPFVLVACVYRAIIAATAAPISKLFIIVTIYCNILALHFLFLVKNTGSWLEIGTSLSHFVIVQVSALTMSAFYFLAKQLTGFDLWSGCASMGCSLRSMVKAKTG